MKKSILILSIFTTVLLGCNEDNQQDISSLTCEVTYPIDGQEYEQGTAIVVKVNAQDTINIVTQVTFTIDDVEKEIVEQAPYSYNWNTQNETLGNHVIKVVATSDIGEVSSNEVAVVLVENTSLTSAPKANFVLIPTSTYVGTATPFINMSLGSSVSWNWDFGDGGTSSEEDPEHIYSAKGYYTVSLEATNEFGTDTEVKEDYVRVNPAITYGSVSDIDGNTYNTVTIGTQEWMAENLRVTKFNDGTEIQLITDNSSWESLEANNMDAAYCYYDNDNTKSTALYTFAAAINSCPAGWHLPSVDDWNVLENFIAEDGLSAYEGYALKTREGWPSSSENGGDDYGFAGKPEGSRSSNGQFGTKENFATWWTQTEGTSSTHAYRRYLSYNSYRIGGTESPYEKSIGHCVRCVKD